MIVEDVSRKPEFIYVVDPSDLSSYDEAGNARQREFIQWVDESEIEFIPSSRYWMMKAALREGRGCNYSGYKYQFWCKTHEDARTFYERWGGKMWCEKRHPEPREMTLKGRLIDGKTREYVNGKWEDEPSAPAYHLTLDGVRGFNTIRKSRFDPVPEGEPSPWGMLQDPFPNLRAFTRHAGRSSVFYFLTDSMQERGRDVQVLSGEDSIVVNIPDDFDDTHEFTVTFRYTVPHDALPEAPNEA